MSELDYITIKGFRSIASIEKLPLRPVNILIGANGAGKSNFVEVFSLLQAASRGRLQSYVAAKGGANRILHFGSAVTRRARIRISFESETNSYRIALTPTEQDELIPSDAASYWNKSRYSEPRETMLERRGMEAGISVEQGGVAAYVRLRRLDSWRQHHFHDTSPTSAMKGTPDLGDNRFLRTDGGNLAAYLYFLGKKHPSEYALIRETVQQVAPFFEDFQIEPLRLDESRVRLEWSHKHSDAYFDASAFSDGTLRFIALATLLLQPRALRPSVVLIDEPELGLHPSAITLLASMMKRASVGSQIIAATQSSLLLDHFEPEDVLVADLKDGATQIRRLESEELGEWLDDYSLGELWEKNQFGGRPGSAG